jgi:hypothetical protein
VRGLRPEVEAEIRDFIEFVLARQHKTHGAPLRQDWAGALRAYRYQYKSLVLQQKALEWRGD